MSQITESATAVDLAVGVIGDNYIGAVTNTATAAASFVGAFSASSDRNLQNALNAFQREKTRVEQEIAELERRIQATRNTIASLNSSITTAENNINSLNDQLRSANSSWHYYNGAYNSAKTDAERSAAASGRSAAQRRYDEIQAQIRNQERERDEFIRQRNIANETLENLLSTLRDRQSRLSQTVAIIGCF